MENPQGGLGRLEDAYDREDSPVWLHPCVCGAVPRLCQAQDALGPLVVRTQGWWLRFGLGEIYRKEPNEIYRNRTESTKLVKCSSIIDLMFALIFLLDLAPGLETLRAL